jgi:hypothetical protein
MFFHLAKLNASQETMAVEDVETRAGDAGGSHKIQRMGKKDVLNAYHDMLKTLLVRVAPLCEAATKDTKMPAISLAALKKMVNELLVPNLQHAVFPAKTNVKDCEEYAVTTLMWGGAPAGETSKNGKLGYKNFRWPNPEQAVERNEMIAALRKCVAKNIIANKWKVLCELGDATNLEAELKCASQTLNLEP